MSDIEDAFYLVAAFSFLKRLRFWLAVVTVGSMLSWAVASAQTPTPARSGISLSVSPPKAELVMSPGGEASGKASVVNLSPVPVEIRASVWDFHVVDTSGTVQLSAPDPSNSQGLATHITLLSPDSFSLAPNAKQEMSYRVNIPSDAAGGSLFGAIVFSSEQPPEPGKVTIVSQVVSLIVARVSGVGLNTLPTSRSQMIFTLPVKEAAGRTIVQLWDPVTKLEVSTQGGTTSISMPVNDYQRVQQGTITAETSTGVVGTGDSAVARTDKLDVESITWQVDLAAGGSKAGTAQVQLSFELKTLPSGSAVFVHVSPRPDAQMQAAINAIAGKVPVRDVAYTVEVSKLRIENLRHVVNAAITLGVSRSWADQYGATLTRIVRYADDGSVQVLETTFAGYEGDTAVFTARSPEGLSSFGLVAFDQPLEPTRLPAGTMPSPSTSTATEGQFVLLLSMDVILSSEATCTNDQGNQAQIDVGKSSSQRTNVLAPTQGEVEIKLARSVQSGKLSWAKAPLLAMAGQNTLKLHFENTGDTDYEAQPGLASVVEMGGNVEVNLQVTNFNAFPGSGRDLDVDWITPSSAFGRYTLAAEVSFGDPLQMAYTEPITVWVLPWKWLLSILLTLGGLTGIGWMVVRSVREYIDKQVKKRVTQSENGDGTAAGPEVTSNDA